MVEMALTSECVAFSSDGKYLAYSTPNGRLLVWETNSGDLKQEYIPSSHLSATCSCLSWNSNFSYSHSPKKKKKKRKSSVTFENNVESTIDNLELLAMGTAAGSILLYSVSRGDLYAQMKSGHSGQVHGVSWHAQSDSLFSCSADQHIVHWNLSSCKVKYKWKGDEREIYSICVLDGKNLLTASGSIKWWDIETRNVLKKFIGHAAEVGWMLPVHYPEKSLEEGYVFSAASSERVINAWQLKRDGDSNSVATCSLSDEPVHVDVSKPFSRDQPVILTAVTQAGTLHIFEHQLNGKCSKPLQPKVTLRITTEGSTESAGRPEPIHVLASHVSNDKDNTIMLAHGNFLRPTFEKIALGECKKDMWLIRQERTATKATHTPASKIREPDKPSNAKILAPGLVAPTGPQASSSKTPKKRKHKDPTSSQLPMEERLNALHLESTTEVTTTPRTDNMIHLLLQGLQSKDRKILDNVFSKQNETLIQNTVMRLPIESIHLFVPELMQRLTTKGDNVHICLRWLRYLLSYHAPYLMTCSDSENLLGPLHELLVSRTESFEKMCRLRGRLDLMLSQINQKDNVVMNLPSEAVFVYQEESSEEEDFAEQLSEVDLKDKLVEQSDMEFNGLYKNKHNRESDNNSGIEDADMD